MSNESTDSTRTTTTPSKFIFESTFYPKIGPDDQIPTEPFLNACRVIVNFLGMLGKIFVPVKADINGHIEKVKKIVACNPEKFSFLDAIIDPAVKVEKKEVKRRKDAIMSLTWLKRSCEFVFYFLTKFTDPENLSIEDLRPLFRDAYERKLKQHHSVVAQKLFQVCVHAAPTRSYTVCVLTGKGDRTEKQVYAIVNIFLQGMRANVECLVRTFDKFELQQ
ncbi:glycolipid transfer protein-like [Tropilaelaps mercedesae]|uniref:Glycolipid transfer protein-like n=1 Tax=Tropilaelaps mercedesae TaxID=418985 RepID=A0A1V9X2R6_9ACAR|nr:glycolipid transfer protein-like [Tropilaelaps mercedesae]